MSKQTEALKLALRSIRELVLDESDDAPALQGARMRKQKAEKALREALAEQPAQRKPLTDEEIEQIWRRVQTNDFHDCVQPFARAIEAKLKEKNHV